MTLKLRPAFFLILTLALSGCCGFKLRGSLDVPEYLRTVYITPYEPCEPFQNALRARLHENKVHVLSQPNANVTILEISKVTSNDQTLAYGSSGEVQRYKLSLTVSYTLIVRDNNNFRIQRSITRTRELNRTNNLLLSNEGEAQIVKQELLNEAVNELLRQITTRPKHKEAVTNNSTTVNNPC